MMREPVRLALLAAAFVLSGCGSGVAKQTAIPTSAPQGAAQASPASVPTFQAALATPATNPVDRMDGTVASVDGGTVTLVGGQSFTVSSNTRINRGLPAGPSDLVPGKIVAVAASMQPNNTLLASQISVFVAAPNPTFFRQYPLDHSNLMTNATIDSGSGSAFTVSFPGGGANVVLAPDARIIAIAEASSADLKAGAMITALVLNGVAQGVSIL